MAVTFESWNLSLFKEHATTKVAKIELGTVSKLKKCKEKWCKVEAEYISGWVRKENLFGVG